MRATVLGKHSTEKSELEELRLMCKSQAVSIKTLENQIGQIASALLNRPQGVLPSDTETNPGKRDGKEQIKAITLRSGKITNDLETETEEQIQLDKELGSRARHRASAPLAAHPRPLEDEMLKC